jgi:hypothetical protein
MPLFLSAKSSAEAPATMPPTAIAESTGKPGVRTAARRRAVRLRLPYSPVSRSRSAAV